MPKFSLDKIKILLDEKTEEYNSRGFVEQDPISVPHSYTLKQDIEIMGFFASILAWGQRKTIINKCKELSDRFDNAPYDFIVNHRDTDLKKLLGFKHRTFNDTDLLYFVDFLKKHYTSYDSLEDAFIVQEREPKDIQHALIHFHDYFFKDAEQHFRTRKHISSPSKKSACKRLNMFLRWMVRKDDNGVDFGIWKQIKPKDLICPLDVHVERTARFLGLIERKNTDWLAAVELTNYLRIFDPDDPVKYDFALFGISIEDKLHI
ncbi:MAG: TIGR02757 family protein [Dysgonomonas sp.]